MNEKNLIDYLLGEIDPGNAVKITNNEILILTNDFKEATIPSYVFDRLYKNGFSFIIWEGNLLIRRKK